MNSLHSLGGRPSCDGRQLGRVHVDATTSYYHAKELDLLLFKLAF